MKKNQSCILKNCPICNSSRLVNHTNTIKCLNCGYEHKKNIQLKLEFQNEK